jgi:subtilisin-like proprotein convertase family protein
VYTLTAGTGYSGPVTLAAAGNPAPTTVSFGQNPLPPPFPASSTATIGNTATLAPGTYAVTFTGASGSENSTVVAGLTLLPSTPSTTTLVAPADNAILGAPTPTLSWVAVEGATGYTVEIARDPAFTDIVRVGASATTRYVVSPALDADAVYYWRVRATNPCGKSGQSSPARFALLPTVTDIACRADLDTPIPDNLPGGVTSQLTVPTVGMIVDIDVTAAITHTWIGHLTARLTSPANTTVTLIDRPGANPGGPGCDQNHIRATLDGGAVTAVEGICEAATADDPPPYAIDGVYRPNNPLSVLDGQRLDGTWRFTVADSVLGETGRLKEWCLNTTSVNLPDFSDLATGYGVAWHSGAGALRLGTLWSEEGAIPMPEADNPTDDGVVVDTATDWRPGGSSTAAVQVTGGAGHLAAWFDWNQNGTFDHPL